MAGAQPRGLRCARCPSAGGHTLWITSYNEQFSIGHEVSLRAYLDWGIGPILGSKVAALAELAGRTLAVAGGVFALFFLGGVWLFRGGPSCGRSSRTGS